VVTLDKAGLTLTSSANAILTVDGSSRINAVTINADDVTVSGLTIEGPVDQSVDQSYVDYTWGSVNSRGIVVLNGADEFTITHNTIQNIRNGILIDGRNADSSVTDNTIDNTKSGISVQYTDAEGITISGNVEGIYGNEWGLNLHLNGYWDGTTMVTNSQPGVVPTVADAPSDAWQLSLVALSDANADWAVQDQGYISFNRTHVTVDETGSTSSQGSQLTPISSLQVGVDAVAAGGHVHVLAGNYEAATVHAEGITIDAEAGANGIALQLADGIENVTALGQADVQITGNELANILTGGDGDDIFIGGDGNDTLTGGAGNDIFTLMADDTGVDTITDFGEGDVLDFSEILSDADPDATIFTDLEGGNTQVSYQGEAIAIIQNVASTDLTVDDSGNVVLANQGVS